MPAVKVETLPVGELQVNCYLLENSATGEVVVVDPGEEDPRIFQALVNRKPVAVVLTHGHYDHFGGADKLCAQFDIPLYVHGEDIPKLLDPQTNGSRLFATDQTLQTRALPLAEGQVLTLAGFPLTVLHTPGHSRGSCCFLLPENQGVLTGDTLFLGGYGRTDIADGNFSELRQSFRRLHFDLPRQIAYPGHGPRAWAGREKEESL